MGNLYDTIFALCESRGIKGGKMCTDLGISKGLLTDLKMGRRTGVSAVTAQKIAAYFDVSVGYLLGEEEKSEKEQVFQIRKLQKERRRGKNRFFQKERKSLPKRRREALFGQQL